MSRSIFLKIILFCLVVLFALTIAWQTVDYFKHRGKVGVNIAVVPADSTLKIDGVQTKPGKIYLIKGTHHLVASRTYFDDDIKNINTADITKNETIYMLPAANSAAAKAYLEQHPDIQQQREAAGGAEAARIQALLNAKYPILSKLPYETLHFKVDYSVDANQNLSLTVTTYGIINGPSDYPLYVQQTAAYKQEALAWLKQNGVGPTTYPITYIPNLSN